jgi:perosamine synthetase
MIPVYQPRITEKMKAYVNDCMQTGWISWQGKYVEKAEDLLKKFTGSKYCLLTNNGTTATHLVARSLYKKNPLIERIYAPSSCYVAAWNSFLFDNRKWKFKLSDLSMLTWNAEYKNIIDNNKSAILVVSNLGNIVNTKSLKSKYSNVIIVEDNCEGFSGKCGNNHSGKDSLCYSLSFFANKNITTGEGGAFLTDDKELYEYCKKLRGQGQTEKRYIHDELGYNYRMTNIQAAMLVAQMEDIDITISLKRKVFDTYKNILSQVSNKNFSLQQTTPGTSHSNWMFGVRFHNLKNFKEAEKFYKSYGVEIRPMFYPYSVHKHLPTISKNQENATLLNRQCVILPSYPDLTKDEINKVCKATKDFIKFLM